MKKKLVDNVIEERIGQEYDDRQRIRDIIEEAGFDKCFSCGSENIFLNFISKDNSLEIQHICKDCKSGFKKEIDIPVLIDKINSEIIISADKKKTISLAALKILKELIKKHLDSKGYFAEKITPLIN